MAHILVIDDEFLIRDTLVQAFTGQGHQVAVAENGEVGLNTARENPPDLILLDITMPRLSGEEVLETLKQDSALRKIPVIILTAETDRAHIINFLSKGANDFIGKPFSIPELLARSSVQLRIQDLEARLRESEAYHRALFEHASDPEMVLIANGTIQQINDAACQLLAVDGQQLINRPIYELVDAMDRKKFEVAFVGALDGSTIPIFEVHLALPGNRLLPVDVDLCPVDIQGQRQLLLQLRDIRQRKSAEAQSSMILQHIGDAIFITDHSGIILMASHSAGTLTGYPAEELIGQDIARFHTNSEDFHTPRQDPHIYESQLRRPNGEEIAVEWTRAAFDVSGETYFIGVVRDLSDRRVAETQRAETVRLQTLLEIAGGAAHEINQPLTAIMGYAEMAEAQLDVTHAAKQYQKYIIDAATRISEIVKQMQAIRTYRTRPYADGHRIVDFDQSSRNDEDAAPEE